MLAPGLVLLDQFDMHRPINFDHEQSRWKGEIRDKWTDRMLSAKRETGKPMLTQLLPQKDLSVGHTLRELPRSILQFPGRSPHPTCSRLPTMERIRLRHHTSLNRSCASRRSPSPKSGGGVGVGALS